MSMQHEPLTLAGLAEIRTQLTVAKGNGIDGLWGDSAIEALLATVDAERERAERAEAERDELKARPTEWAYEQACKALEKHTKGEREALALLAETRRALDAFQTAAEDAISIAENTGEPMNMSPWEDLRGAVERHGKALSLTAPEALAQQQEREAGLVAMVGALRGALESLLKFERDGRFAPNGGVICEITEALELTPPQALSEWRERMEAAKELAEILKEFHEEGIAVLDEKTRALVGLFGAAVEDGPFDPLKPEPEEGGQS